MNREYDLKKHVELIARKHGGIEGLRALVAAGTLRPPAEPLESVRVPGAESRMGSVRVALETLALNREPDADSRYMLEAIIDADLRPAIDIVDGSFTSGHPLWTQLSDDAAIRSRLEAACRSVGRIDLPANSRLPYGGTGFVVGRGLIMTNRHVAELFATGLGTRITFTPGAAAFNPTHELNRPTGPSFKARRVVMIHPYWDMALLEIEGIDTLPSLPLALADARDLSGRDIALVGYPSFDPRNPADVQSNLFQDNYGVKRLLPGELHSAMNAASFGKIVRAATHDSSTLGGVSGAALIDLQTGQVLGLHFGGVYREQNYAVPSSELGRDARVIDAGVTFDGPARADAAAWPDWWARADAFESADPNGDGQSAPAPTPTDVAALGTRSERRYEIEIPLKITVTIGETHAVGAVVTAVAASDQRLETMRSPWHETDYAGRSGYDPDFLRNESADATVPSVPMPTAADPNVLARTTAGEDVLKYQNFSIRMHAARRIALVTASNVTKESALRKPEPGRDYSRKGLSGLGPNDIEQWFPDPRLEAQFQLPDVFYNKDRQAFDKGHLVRREDVAWGRTYDELRRGNGDTYHLTNCSPQVGDFNRSVNGVNNWGDLENLVLAQAASERLCVFAGPVLDANDQIFQGKGPGGARILVRIPSRFWKVIVTRADQGLGAYGFVLEQDLSDVQFEEFAVAREFIPMMTPIVEIAAATGVTFAPAITDADQYHAVTGLELAIGHGLRRQDASQAVRRGSRAAPTN
ncbi:DNA/RNA non-specific endonuclease [Opitutus sp. ER46]|uniref:DNA/RNA non-specific endonuclease n=1 Tax=Opitutus sp. ER46 TaxID=2161864 RepID=UPI00130504F5|nr:DNA/RNA non-specific endonuclease [Opitutus sp. ER46]